MIKYLLLVCLITAPLAQTPEAIVTHYDLDGNLIEEDSSLMTQDIDNINSMIMDSNDMNMDSMSTESNIIE